MIRTCKTANNTDASQVFLDNGRYYSSSTRASLSAFELMVSGYLFDRGDSPNTFLHSVHPCVGMRTKANSVLGVAVSE